MENLDPIDQRIAKDKNAMYRGTARVSITHLDFPHTYRQIDRKVIAQLKRDFEGEGCNKDEPANRIPAIIDDATLKEGLEKLAISVETFKAISDNDPPYFPLSQVAKLECLHGQHRILAGKETSQKWWVVDLYSTGQYFQLS